ncbi:hypothetical protein Dsin_015365 [Dipteronia sinensis]|uniref:RING-type E3 ubiquitin transferase n=1 Tax=Dipteronia sinensis TaxID=43782 RepID=A0AAE0ABE2_9ROSI|nr:hypothetical protein Dsin_015365 [Dipteronia sinensis]
MNQFWVVVSLLLLCRFLFHVVEAQSVFNSDDARSEDAVTSFKPSLAVVIGILCVMFSLTFFLLIYAKFCHRGSSSAANHTDNQQNPALIRSNSRFSGIDKTVIESLPFFRFSSLKGSKQGLECAVCLSKFEDTEILRLLPKCRHAFHINCIDQWLEKHSSCPLCRHKVSIEDPTIFTYSNSMRLMFNQSELREDSNIELFVQREEEEDHKGSSRFSIGSSFRKTKEPDKEEDQILIQVEDDVDSEDDDRKILHKLNHKIIVSDVILKNRWSSASSSDLMFLNSEMLNAMSSNRFSSTLEVNDGQISTTRAVENNDQIMQIKEEMEKKRLFESKLSTINKTSPVFVPVLPSSSNSPNISSVHTSRTIIDPTQRRSVSEITALSRFQDSNMMKNRMNESCLDGNERMRRRLWLPIARRTVQWFADREKRSQQSQSQNQSTPQSLDV